MLGDMTPFHLAGNIYFVGTKKESSHIIDTGEGLIMIDAGGNFTADVALESMATLGFDAKDLKYILLSHGHRDHSDGAPKIAALSGAKICMCPLDNKYLLDFLPDIELKDGDVISLGNTQIQCMHTPGHTEGTMSFFFMTEVDGVPMRAGMFGGAGINQMRKAYLDRGGPSSNKLPLAYGLRGQFFASVQRLKQEHVDIFLGNHCHNNHTLQKYEKSLTSEENPFIDPEGWQTFLQKRETELEAVLEEESTTLFVNYAHRGASEYAPENTMLAFYTGMYMGANGIETDVQRTKDGKLVLFHDATVDRVTEATGNLADFTYDELQQLFVTKNGLQDKIVLFEDFLQHFAFRDITFAIELKGEGVEEETADLLRKYDMLRKTVVTSFKYDYIKKFKEYAPEFRVGLLTSTVNDEIIEKLKAIGADELCPRATLLTRENVLKWRKEGFRVRAWGVTHKLMAHACRCGVDGMTVNFPDRLADYLRWTQE